MTVVEPNSDGYAMAVEALSLGKVVAYPTESAYGLGVDPFIEGALARLFEAKGRANSHPVLVIANDTTQVNQLVGKLSSQALEFAARFWPGPLSMLLRADVQLAPQLMGEGGRVCVRVPGSEIARLLCARYGSVITSTSANLSGQPAAQALEDIQMPGIAVGIDGGRLGSAPPSTVFDPDTGEILREGQIGADELKRMRLK